MTDRNEARGTGCTAPWPYLAPHSGPLAGARPDSAQSGGPGSISARAAVRGQVCCHAVGRCAAMPIVAAASAVHLFSHCHG